MNKRIEELVKKYWCTNLLQRDFRNALTELSATHAIELRAYEATVQNLEQRITDLEDVLRSLACSLSAGGYNADVVDPAAFEKKIKDGIDMLVTPLQERIRQMESELETERMRLAACGVIAMANTQETAAKAREMRPEYWSASAQDCANAVDREMALRERIRQLEAALEIIAGRRQCIDNTMSNAEVAMAALPAAPSSEQRQLLGRC